MNTQSDVSCRAVWWLNVTLQVSGWYCAIRELFYLPVVEGDFWAGCVLALNTKSLIITIVYILISCNLSCHLVHLNISSSISIPASLLHYKTIINCATFLSIRISEENWGATSNLYFSRRIDVAELLVWVNNRLICTNQSYSAVH